MPLVHSKTNSEIMNARKLKLLSILLTLILPFKDATAEANECSLVPGTGSEATASRILTGYFGWTASGIPIDGTLPNLGSINLATTSPSLEGYYSGFSNGTPAASTICSGSQILGVSGSATCSTSLAGLTATGDLNWGTLSTVSSRTLTLTASSSGSNVAAIGFSGDGTSSFRILEVAGKSVDQLASVSGLAAAVTNPGQVSTTVKIKPIFSGGNQKSMTMTITDAAGSQQIVSVSAAFVNGPTATNRVLWLKSDEGVYYNSSNAVSLWADQSGNGHDAIQGNTSKQPLFVESAVNNNPALRFDGSNDVMTLSGASFAIAQVYTVFKSVTSTFATYGSVLGAQNSRPFIFENGQTYFHGSNYPTEVWKNGTSLSSPFNLGTITNYMALTINTNAPSTSRIFYIGAPDTDSLYGNLEIAEIIGYSAANSDSDRQAIESYLATKYGL